MKYPTFSKKQWGILLFIAAYLLAAGWYFLRDLNFEFVIYVGVLIAVFGFIYGTLHVTRFPDYQLALLAIWGLLHVLGGWVVIDGGVLFAYRVYPVLDLGGEFYILKYDQFVHFYLYGVVALMFVHLLRRVLRARGNALIVYFTAAMASLGVSGLNEIMEFLIAMNLERHGVGGYENALLDIIFNFAGALLAVSVVTVIECARRKR